MLEAAAELFAADGYAVRVRLQGPAPAEAEGFRRFLLSPAGRAILMRRGFGAP